MPLPRQRSDTGDYFKGASLGLLSAETEAGRHIHTHSLQCSLQECGYRLGSGSESINGTTQSIAVTGHPDTGQYPWWRFFFAALELLVLPLTQSPVMAQVSVGETICIKGRFLELLLPTETCCTVALIMEGQSTSVNTACQVKVKIRSQSI